MPGHDPDEVGEHLHVRGQPGTGVADQELPEGALQAAFVQLLRPVDDLEQGVSQCERVAPVDGEQQPLHRCAQLGVDACDRAEVEQPELAVSEQHDVAGMWVGVEDAIEHHLA